MGAWKPWRVVLLATGLALMLASLTLRSSAPAEAQSGGPYDLSWSTIDGGGGTSSGGAYAVSGTIGQADASTLSGGDYSLAGGFWTSRRGGAVHRVYLPVVTKMP